MNSILSMFRDPSVEDFTAQEKDEIIKACIRYLFKLISLAEFKNQLSGFNLTTEIWRSNANSNKAIFKIRLWLRYLTKYPKRNVAKKFEIESKHDVEIKAAFLSDTALFKQVKNIKGQVFTWKRFKNILAKVADEIKPFIKRRVRTKLTFLEGDTGNGFEDFESELLAYVIAGVHAKYPRFDSYLHLQNTARTIINNMSINIIKYYTSLSRQNKYQNADGTFSTNKVSLDALTENAAAQEMDIDLSHHDTAFEEVEVKHTIQTLANSPAKQRAFKLLVGEDKAFTLWLHETGKCTVEDNMKLQTRLINRGQPQTYIGHIAEYLNVPMRKLMAFYKVLLQNLSTSEIARA